jgi:hypothetical protein
VGDFVEKHNNEGSRQESMISRLAATAPAAATGLSLIIPSLLLFSIIMPLPSAFAQTYHQNTVDGFRVQVPAGWVIDDIDNTDPDVIANEEFWNASNLALICLQKDALPSIGGTFRCNPESIDNIAITRFGNLHERPEFAALEEQGKAITLLDVVALRIDLLESSGGLFSTYTIGNVRMNNITDRSVNIIDSETNQTIATTPAKFIELVYTATYPIYFSAQDLKMFSLLVLSSDADTGFSVSISARNVTDLAPSPAVKQVMDSFELVEEEQEEEE